MNCPSCSARSRVVETRAAEDGLAVRRRRECERCGRRFTTYERRGPEALYVRKRDGSRQRFDREKLRDSLLGAAHKRDVSDDDVEAILDAAEATVRDEPEELPSAAIGELCLRRLRELDWGAYLQFAGTLPDDSAEFAPADASPELAVPSGPRARMRSYPRKTARGENL